jgi:N-acetylmuramoyl-L-alanine amidase
VSNRWGSSESRWSSERDRAERERRERELDAQDHGTARPRRSWREGTSGTGTGSSARRFVGGEGGSRGQRPPEPEASRESPSSGTGGKPSPIGRKWRSSAPPPPDEGPSLPNLPGDDNGGRKGGGTSNRILIFGALLFALMAVVAFLPFGPFGGDDDAEPTNTPSLAVIPTDAAQDSANRDGRGTPPPTRPSDSEMVVCIDPGHGGWDFGRQRQDPDYGPPYLNESEINLGMALMLRDELEARGVAVVLTRETGTAVNIFSEDVNQDGRTILDSQQDGDRDELQARINICNQAEADILVSLHLNGFDDDRARGYEVLYTPAPTREFGAQNLDLATALYREIGAAYNRTGFETDPRGVTSDEEIEAELHEFGSERNFVLTGPAVNNPDYSIVPSNMPGAIVEPVFITNQDDVNFIVLPENQVLLAEAYAEGIMTYFDKYPG